MTNFAATKVSAIGSLALFGAGGLFALTDAVQISIITSAGAVLMAGVSAYFAYRAKTIAQETHIAVNSRLTQLLELSKQSSRAEGKLEGQAEATRNKSSLTKPQNKP